MKNDETFGSTIVGTVKEPSGVQDNDNNDESSQPVIVYKKTRVRVKKRKIKPYDFPKRPLSPYNIFFRENKERMKRANMMTKKKQNGCDTREGEVSMVKHIATLWKTIDPQERARIEKLAKDDTRRYNEEVSLYEEKKKKREKEARRQKQLQSKSPLGEQRSDDETSDSGEDDESPVSSFPTRKPRKRKITPEDFPKRPLSAYNFFFKEHRNKLLKAQQNSDKHPDVSMVKQISNIWKAIAPEERSIYKQRANTDLERYKIAVNDYELKKVAKRRRRLDREESERKAAAKPILQQATGTGILNEEEEEQESVVDSTQQEEQPGDEKVSATRKEQKEEDLETDDCSTEDEKESAESLSDEEKMEESLHKSATDGQESKPEEQEGLEEELKRLVEKEAEALVSALRKRLKQAQILRQVQASNHRLFATVEDWRGALGLPPLVEQGNESGSQPPHNENNPAGNLHATMRAPGRPAGRGDFPPAASRGWQESAPMGPAYGPGFYGRSAYGHGAFRQEDVLCREKAMSHMMLRQQQQVLNAPHRPAAPLYTPATMHQLHVAEQMMAQERALLERDPSVLQFMASRRAWGSSSHMAPVASTLLHEGPYPGMNERHSFAGAGMIPRPDEAYS